MIKHKILANYWGQLCTNGVLIGSKGWDDVIDDLVLNLFSLELLSDQDLHQLAIMVNKDSFYTNTDFIVDRSSIGYITVRSKNSLLSTEIYFDGEIRCYDEFKGYVPNNNLASAIDYLRLKGYAMPYLGYPIEYLEESKIFLVTKADKSE